MYISNVRLADKYYTEIVNICKKVDINSHMDLSHDVYLKMINNPPKENYVKAWIYRVAKNKFIDSKRKPIKTELPVIAEDQTINFELELEEIMKESMLNSTERLWIQAYIDNELSYVKIEETINISRQHASKRIREVMSKIKKAWEKYY